MPASLLAAASFLVLLAVAAVLLQRLLTRQVKELHASLRRTDDVVASADELRARVAEARQRRDHVADAVRGISDR
jgi:hypothetical protein